jgi:hypothetical protein
MPRAYTDHSNIDRRDERKLDEHPLLSRDFPANLDERKADRRQVVDTRVDIDLTNPNIGADRRHRERRQFKLVPMPPSAFAKLGEK